MRNKIFILVAGVLAVLVAAVFFSQKAGSLFEKKPTLRTDGTLDYARFFNEQLGKMSPADRALFLYKHFEKLDDAQLPVIFAQQKDINPIYRDQVAEVLTYRWAASDCNHAWQAFVTEKSFPMKQAQTLIRIWANTDVQGALKAIQSLENTVHQKTLIGRLVSAYAAIDPRQAAEISRNPGIEAKGQALSAAIALWAQADLEGAITYALENDLAGNLREVFAYEIYPNGGYDAMVARLNSFNEKDRDKAVGAILEHHAFVLFYADDIERLLNEFPSPDRDTQHKRFKTLFYHLCNRDIRDAFERMLKLSDAALQKELIRISFYSFSQADTPAALNFLTRLQTILKEKDFLDVVRDVSYGLLRRDPIGTVAFLNTLQYDPRLEEIKHRLPDYLDYEGDNLDKAVELFSTFKFSKDYEKPSLYANFAARLFRKDPEAALRFMQTLQDPKIKQAIGSRYVEETTKKDFAKGLALYKELSASIGRAWFSFYDAENFDAVAYMKMAREALTGYTQAETLGNIVSEAFRRNDASATELFDSLPEGQAKENAFRTLMHELAQNDPMKALELLETQGSEPSTRYSKNWLLGEIVKKDFEGGLAMLHSEQWLPKIFGNEDTWSFSGEGGLISQLMKTDAALVRAHIEQMPEQYKAQALSAYILRLASDNAAVAAQELTNLPDSQQTRDVTQNVLRQWSEFQPRQAMQWVCEQYPDSEDKTAAMHYKDVLRQWVKVEPEAASQWLAEQPAGLARDSMVVGLIDSEKYGEPEVSMQWAQSITDKNRREGSIAGIFSVWRTFDPQAATQALETSGLGPERIKELIQQPLLRHETHNNYRTYYFH